MADEIPFSTFSGNLKQLETEFREPIMRALFETCFSKFSDLDADYARLKQDGINYLVTAAGSEYNFGFRPRRFAGGPGLPPSRYFVVCDADSYNDRGTLRDELTAYYQGASGIRPMIFDPLADPFVLEQLLETGSVTEESLQYPLYYVVFRLERRTDRNAHLAQGSHALAPGEAIGVTYGVRQYSARIDRVVDLRDPDTQDWFVKTFVDLELENAEAAERETGVTHIPRKPPLESFERMLPVITSLQTGGGASFGQAVGHWLRRHGANGLIFPSARSNVFCRVRNGVPSEWGGWNMVVYAGAAEPEPRNLFGQMNTWRDPDHDHIRVHYVDQGDARGTMSVRGLREFNLVDFDFDKRIACGAAETNVLLEVTGVRNAQMSSFTNAVLDAEERANHLWFNDVDYVSFVEWLESRWRKTDA